jgi:hemoglobin-like flavoprotein
VHWIEGGSIVNVIRRHPSSVFDSPGGAVPVADVALVAGSYRRVEDRGSAASVAFFTRVHEASPRLRRIFPHDDLDKRALAREMFDLVALHLDAQSELQSLLERMGRRGLLDGVSVHEVGAISAALLTTLREFDTAWSDDVERAWATVFAWVLAALRRGARVRTGRA